MVKEIMEKLVSRINYTLQRMNKKKIENFISILMGSQRVFIVGAGRSGLVGKSFAMRLMHLGFNVYVVGETITPAMKPNDLLIAISGSGMTSSTLLIAKTAKKLGAIVVAITSRGDSPLANIADHVVKIKGRGEDVVRDYLSDQLKGVSKSLTPLGTLFELSTAVFLDSIITRLMELLGKDEDELKKKHTNLE